MPKKRYSESEIRKILKEYKEGAPKQRIIEKYGISQATFYNWKSKYGNFSSEDIVQLHKLKEDNERLKRMFADLSLENMALKAKLKKKHYKY